MRNYAGTCKDIFSYNLMYKILIQLLTLQSSHFVVHSPKAFQDENEAFPKGRSYNKIASLFVIFHLPYSKYRGVLKWFHSFRYQNQNFSLVSDLCCSCNTRVALMSFAQHPYLGCVALVLLVSHSCCTRVAFMLFFSHSCRTCLALVF